MFLVPVALMIVNYHPEPHSSFLVFVSFPICIPNSFKWRLEIYEQMKCMVF